MTRFMELDRGEELRLKLLATLPPFREADVLRVRPARGAACGRHFVVYRDGAELALRQGEASPGPGARLGVVIGVERGQLRVAVDRPAWRRLPSRYWPMAIDVLEILRRARRPLTPPLFQGAAAAMLRGVLDKYDAPLETSQYGALATGELDEVERALVTTYVPAGGRILDIGCGGGREAVALARLGYRVVGIDIAPGMIEAARRSAARFAVSVEFRVQSVTELAEPPGSYDAVFFAGSFHHVPGRARRVDVLRRVRRALTPAGVLILMVVYRERRGVLSRSRLVDGVRRLAWRLGASGAVAEPGDDYMIEVSEGSDPMRACFFHHYDDAGDVRGELETAGFTADETRPGWWICRPDSVGASELCATVAVR